jgi:hypothetical protein
LNIEGILIAYLRTQQSTQFLSFHKTWQSLVKSFLNEHRRKEGKKEKEDMQMKGCCGNINEVGILSSINMRFNCVRMNE